MRISDWSSDVCSSDLANPDAGTLADREHREHRYTVRDLLADHHIRTYSDVRHYASQGDSRLEILANETDPATSAAFNEQDSLEALKTLDEIGRATGREKGCQYVMNSGGAGDGK